MRILQILNRVPWPLKDGGAIMYYHFTKGYHDAGCEVTIASLNTTKHYVSPLPNELTDIAQIHTVDIDNRVKVIPAFLNLFTKESYHIQRFKSAAFEQLLSKLLSQQTFDVIVFESLSVAQYLPIVRNHSNALCVLRQHNVEHEIWELLARETTQHGKKWYLNLLASRLKKYEQTTIQQFDALTTVTENDSEVFRRLGFTKSIHTAPLGISIDMYPVIQSSTQKPFTLFHLGSMDWEPNKYGVSWFINSVWPTVYKQFPQAALFLAGRKMDTGFLENQLPGITIVGEVQSAFDFMSDKQIMLVPLFSGSGIRVKILEGMAAGKAIISTSLGAQGIHYEHGKNILIANTADEFCQCIEQLFNNTVLCESLGNEARKLIEQEYSNTKVIADVLSFYKHELGRKQI